MSGTNRVPNFNRLDPLTTKGDTLTHNGTDSIRLGVGTNGQVLTADSTTASGLVWREGGSGSGINFLQTNGIEWSFEATANGIQPVGWNRYSNGASAVPPTPFAAGSPNADWTFLGTTTTPLYGNVSALLTKTANNRQGCGIATDAFTITSGSLNDVVYISMNYDFGSTSIASGDLVVYILDVTNNTLITPSVVNFPTGGKGVFRCSFVSTSSTSYRLYLHQAGTSATAYTLELDQIVIGPGQAFVGPDIGPWQSYTSTRSGVTGGVSVVEARFRRVGSSLEGSIDCLFSTIFTGGDTPTFTLPTGLTIDTTALPNGTSGQQAVGTASLIDTGTAIYNAAAYVTSTTQVSVYTSASPRGLVTTSNPFTWVNNDRVNLNFMVPIAEWAGSSVGIGANDVEFAWNSDVTSTASVTSSGFSYGPSGGEFGSGWAVGTNYTRRVRYQTAIQRMEDLRLKFSADSGATWVDFGSDVNATSLTYQSGTIYGASISQVSTTDVDVVFRAGGRVPNGGTLGANGAAWSGLSGGAFRWRLEKSISGIPVGFGAATATASGLVTTTTQTLAGVKTFNNGIQVSASSSILSDFVTTTSFTPTVGGSSTAGAPGSGYSVQIGRYARVGPLVFYTLHLVWSGGHTGTGNMVVFGLPITTANVTSLTYAASVYYDLINFQSTAAETQLIPTIAPNDTRIQMYSGKDNSAVNAVLMSDNSGSGTRQLILSGWYFV